MAYYPYRQLRSEPMHVEVRTRTTGDPMTLLPAIQRVVQSYGPDIPLVKPMTQEQQFGDDVLERAVVLRPRDVLRPDGGAARRHRAVRDTHLPDQPAHVRNRRAHRARRGARSGVVDDRAREPGRGDRRHRDRRTARDHWLEWLASTLFGLTPGDPISFAVALAAVTLVTVGASLAPARRAATLDPMRALRSE